MLFMRNVTSQKCPHVMLGKFIRAMVHVEPSKEANRTVVVFIQCNSFLAAS
jgi:hypothetical protein